MAEIRRLAVCLDGTWNNRDDSTNVLHHFALTSECRDKRVDNDRVTQLKFYLEGVGTGPLDAITGGGFGFGLETNVRAAYNWLVQNYQDETAFTPADEIYIFGFSRGAFTARSLVGFISTCCRSSSRRIAETRSRLSCPFMGFQREPSSRIGPSSRQPSAATWIE